MLTGRNILLPFSINCCIKLFKKYIFRQPEIEKSIFGHSKISNQSENFISEQILSSQNKHEFCNKTQRPNNDENHNPKSERCMFKP